MKWIRRNGAIIAAVLCGMGLALQPAAVFAQSPGMPSNGVYAALGDSVAAGAGLPAMGGASAEDMACGRSSAAYPHVISNTLGLHLAHIACGGALASDLYGSQTVGSTSLAPQIDAAFANGTPKLITLTVGANDLGWSAAVSQCYHGGDCGTATQTAMLTAARVYMQLKLGWALWQIDQKSNFHMPQVVITSYFAPFNTSADAPTCADNAGLTTAKMQWLNDQESMLDQAIQTVTLVSHMAQYAHVNFAGHELCSAKPWIQGLQEKAPFHPTAEGQQAIAKTILDTICQ